MKKNRALIIFLGFVLSLNIYFRSFPVYFPQLKIQAKKMVETSIQQAIVQEINKKFPQFYYSAKDAIVKNRVAEYKKQNKKTISKQTRDLYLKIKDRFQDDSGQTYLMELDCWHWGRYVENILRSGRPGDEVLYGRQWDMLMLAPTGAFVPIEHFLFYISAVIYKIFSILKAIPLFTFLFYVPLFFITIFIIAAYFFTYRYGGHISAIIACLYIGLAPIFLPRSCAGWFDMDILSLLFPLLIIWTYALSNAAGSFKTRMSWLVLSSFFVSLFCFTWPHWWFIFSIIILYEILYIGYAGFKYIVFKKETSSLLRRHVMPVVLFMALSVFWISLIMGRQPLQMIYHRLRQAFSLSEPLMKSIWPNVLSTVGEMRKMGVKEMMRSVGGSWAFSLSIIGMAALSIRALGRKKMPHVKRTCLILLMLWFFPMGIASLKSVRLAMFLLPPLAIFLGWGTGELYTYFTKKKNIKGAALIIIAACVISAMFITKAYRISSNIYPLMDDTWYKVLNLMNEKTRKDMIINSWWDYGDWFKAVAKRRVIFDGQSQDTPQAYWMAKAMLTHDETKAVGILRMLNNGGNRAFEIINEYLDNQLLSTLLLEGVIGLTPQKTREVLAKFLPESVTVDVMRLLFSAPPPAGFVVDYTMIYKMPAISYLGDWNFSKVYIAQNFNKIEKNQIVGYLKNLGQDDNLMQRFYQEVFLISTKNLDDWLSQKLQFYSPLVNGREKDGVVYFETGFAYNIKDNTVQSNSGQIPRSAFIQSDNGLVESQYPNPSLPFSLLIFKTKDGFKSICLDRDLAKSLFVRLYFLGGKGLSHFSSFIDSEEGNNYIRLFNIIW